MTSRRARSRLLRPVEVVLLVLVAALGPAVLAVPTTPVPASASDQTGAKAVPVASGPLELGVNVFAMWRDWRSHDLLFDRVQESGSGWVRVDLSWCDLEPQGPGQVEPEAQGRLDEVVDGLAQRELRPLIVITCAPEWAGGTAAHPYPDDPAQFERVTRWLAERYRGRVAAWEIGNEPDCIGGCPRGSAEAYVPLLQAGYRGIKAADPTATVVTGGTSGNNARWTARMYAAGAHGFFDVLAVHPYVEPMTMPPDAPSEGKVYRLTSVSAVRAVMEQNGDGNKPIWFTEFGWTTGTTGPAEGVSEVTQAQYLQQAVELIRRDYPYVTRAFWYCLRDRDDLNPYENSFGLVHLDGSAKPAFAALQAANQSLAGP
jgi:hypothetical protein